MREIHVLAKPLDRCSDDVLDAAGNAIHAAVSTPNVRDYLAGRHLYGVIARHSQSGTESAKSLHKSQADMKLGVALTSLLLDPADERVIGMSSVYPGLPLRAQNSSRPPGIDKRLRFFGSKGVVDTQKLGANATAWAVPERPVNVRGYEMTEDDIVLMSAYKQLRSQAWQDGQENLWTIEPVASEGVQRALYYAGYQQVQKPDAAYYDDNESQRQPLALSHLYTVTTRLTPDPYA